MLTLTREAWIGVLSEVFGVSVKDRMDEIDIAWDGLSHAFSIAGGFDSRSVKVLQLRYGNHMTLVEIGKRIERRGMGWKHNYIRTGKRGLLFLSGGHAVRNGPVSQEAVRQIVRKAIRRLKHPIRMSVFQSCISGWWRLSC